MISVVLATYNGQEYIKQQLESIIQQTVKPDEIVIVDDCSNDLTLEVIKEISSVIKTPIYLHENKSNLGSTKTFEKALQLSKGDVIFFADQDDYWVPNKIELFVEAFNKNKSAVLVFSNGLLVDEKLESLGSTNWDKYNINSDVLSQLESEKAFAILSDKNYVTGASMAIKRSVADVAIPFFEAMWHDHWLALVASLKGDVITISENTFYYRQHNKQQVGIKSKLKRNRFSLSYLEDFFKQERRIKRVVEKAAWYELLNSNTNDNSINKAELKLFGAFQSKRLDTYKITRFRRVFLLTKLFLNKQYHLWCRRPYEDFFYDLILSKTKEGGF